MHVSDGRIVNIDPQPLNRATPKGVCLKGLSYFERAHSPDRILYPLKRTASGGFERISWDEALETIARRIGYFKKHFGPHSILFYE
ncbi:hypothetical protein D4R75_09280, partial [bacterium]